MILLDNIMRSFLQGGATGSSFFDDSQSLQNSFFNFDQSRTPSLIEGLSNSFSECLGTDLKLDRRCTEPSLRISNPLIPYLSTMPSIKELSKPISDPFNYHFESDSEETFPEPLLRCDDKRICFLVIPSKEVIQSLTPSNSQPLSNFFSSHKIAKNQKKYVCDFCSSSFDTAAGKGGHIAKNHSLKSQKYRQRKFSHTIRRSERCRNKFLSDL